MVVMTYLEVDRAANSHDSTIEPQVSVLMPCHNAGATVDEAVETILNQTLGEWELVAVDDGSEDDTLERLHAWQARDGRVRPIAMAHAGIIEALNRGLSSCRAALIARMDADDHAHPERLQEQAGFLTDNPQVAAVSCLVYGFPREHVREGFRIYIDWLNSLISPEDIAREIFVESPMAHPSVMMRRSWIERLGGYQEHGWPEDYDLWLRMHLAGARFAKTPRELLGWREHESRLTRTDSRYSVENFLRAKAHYLVRGPLQGRDALILWGAGQMGRRLSKHLLREGAPLVAFIDIDERKIGRTRRGKPILSPDELLEVWGRYRQPILLVAVGSRGARGLIRSRLVGMDLTEGEDWWAVA
jgi:glycosyltransferase involved in cell wall biosynthesis